MASRRRVRLLEIFGSVCVQSSVSISRSSMERWACRAATSGMDFGGPVRNRVDIQGTKGSEVCWRRVDMYFPPSTDIILDIRDWDFVQAFGVIREMTLTFGWRVLRLWWSSVIRFWIGGRGVQFLSEIRIPIVYSLFGPLPLRFERLSREGGDQVAWTQSSL